MLSKKSDEPYGSVQTFHRDYDSLKNLAILIYWTKTSQNDGSTQLIKKCHIRHWKNNPNAYDLKKDKLISLASKPGDIYLLDPSMSHRGSPSLKHNRLFTWIRFSYFPAIMYYLGEHYKAKNLYLSINKKIFNKTVNYF